MGNKLPLSGLTSVTSGKTDFLRVTLTVPETADNSFQGLKSTINFAFDAIQRAAASK